MKIILAPDSFKGSLSAFDFVEVASKECLKFNHEIYSMPLSDGGEGCLEILFHLLGGEYRYYNTFNPLMDKIKVPVLFIDNKAFIESAKVIGINLVKEKKPLEATSYGLGYLLKQIDSKYEINVFLGGSATNDGGRGMMEALDGKMFKKINIMCDVTNPLYGENGATMVFSTQKGANDSDKLILEERLKTYAKGYENIALSKGAGAAGGLGFSFMAFLKAKYVSGIDYLLDLYGFNEIDADLVITGEGKYDNQSYNGKLISGIRKRTKARVVVFCGKNETNDIDVFSLNSKIEKKDTIDKLVIALRNFLEGEENAH